jgi:TolB-like protein
MRKGFRLFARIALIAAAAALGAGCASSPLTFRAPGPGVPTGSTLAVLPLNNLTEDEQASPLFTGKLLLELGNLRHFVIQDPGIVLGQLRELRILVPDRMSREQMAELSARSGAEYFLVGTITDCQEGGTTPPSVPVAGLILRLVRAATGTVVWGGSLARTGRDQETFFGLGRRRNLDRLATEMCRDLTAKMRGLDRTGPPLLASAKKKDTP